MYFQKLRQLAPAKLEGKDKGNLIAIITSDIELLEVFYAHTISPVCIAVLTCAVMLVFFAGYHPALAVIALAGYVTVGGILPMLTSKMGKEDGNRYRNQFGEINTYFLDSIRGLREVIQYDSGEKRLKKIDQQSGELTKLQGRLKKCEGTARANCDSAILFFSFLMLSVSVYLYQKNMLTAEGVVISTISMLGSFGPVTALSNLANNLLHTFASGNRVLELLEEEPLVEEVEETEKKPSFAGFSMEHLSFSYKQGGEEDKILSDVSAGNSEKRDTWHCRKERLGKVYLDQTADEILGCGRRRNKNFRKADQSMEYQRSKVAGKLCDPGYLFV